MADVPGLTFEKTNQATRSITSKHHFILSLLGSKTIYLTIIGTGYVGLVAGTGPINIVSKAIFFVGIYLQ